MFEGIEILPNLTKDDTIRHLKRYCTIDDLYDSIYVKKLGNDKTTFAIDFNSDETSMMRKIKDENGNNIEEMVFEANDDYCCDDVNCDDVNCDDVNCDDVNCDDVNCDDVNCDDVNCDDDRCDDDGDTNKKNVERIICPECETKCEVEYRLSEADEFSEDELIPIYAECKSCGWSVC